MNIDALINVVKQFHVHGEISKSFHCAAWWLKCFLYARHRSAGRTAAERAKPEVVRSDAPTGSTLTCDLFPVWRPFGRWVNLWNAPSMAGPMPFTNIDKISSVF